MAKVIVLGGGGGVGSVAARTLASAGLFDEITVADYRLDAARKTAASLGRKMRAVRVDAGDRESLVKALSGSCVVLNCVGPFYKFGPPILEAAIQAGIDYVDVCDDLDATERMLEMDASAREAGIRALIGMGNSPGLANVLARFCADTMLDSVDSVDIYHAHGGEPSEGPGVIKHRIHAMISDIPLFVDGEFVRVKMLEESGQRFVEEVEFRDVGRFPVYPYPHPETITIPRHIQGIKRVTNMGVVLPLSYFNLTMDAVRLGICTEDPLEFDGGSCVPIDFAVAHILAQRPRLLAEAGMTGPQGCLKVVVKGLKEGGSHTYVFQMSSRGAGAGEGTGIPAALGAILMSQGRVKGQGVLPPEACVVPGEMLELAGRITRDIPGAGTGGEVPLFIEHVDGSGKREAVDFKF